MASPRFYSALTALLFSAVCAYLGAALYGGLESPRAFINFSPSREAVSLSGIVLRREELLECHVPDIPGTDEGLRLSPGETFAPGAEPVTETALFFPYSDGFEYLSPSDGENLSPDKLNALLASQAEKAGGPKLIYGFDFYYAAFISGYDNIDPGPCRIKFEGFDSSCPAEIITVSREGSRVALLMRLTQGGRDYLSLRFAEAELIYPQPQKQKGN